MYPKMLTEFRSLKSDLKNLADKVEVLLRELLDLNSIPYHSISSRVKTEESLTGKILRKKSKYNDIYEITDMVGCRIITYLEDDVDKVVEVIKSEFNVDNENSIDKKAVLDPDRFGYLSYHIVCSISESRKALREYEKYDKIRFEIQVRSILQHAWAEIEHDLGYKSNLEIPKMLIRRFSRVAGLLEIADSEFCEIKQRIEAYKQSLDIHQVLLDASIDKDSLATYIHASEIVSDLDSYICHVGGYTLIEEGDDGETEIEWLARHGITTIRQLDQSLKENVETIKKFSQVWINDDDLEDSEPERLQSVSKGISLFYLNYILVAKNTHNLEDVAGYFQEREIGFEDAITTAKKLMNCYQILVESGTVLIID